MVNWIEQRRLALDFFTKAVHEDDLVPSFAVSRALGVGNKRIGSLGIPRVKIQGVWCYRKRDVLEYLERSIDDPANPYFAFRQQVRVRWDKQTRRYEERRQKRWGRYHRAFRSTAEYAEWFAAQEAIHHRWKSVFQAQYDILLAELHAKLKLPGSAPWAKDIQALENRLDDIGRNYPEWDYLQELAVRKSEA